MKKTALAILAAIMLFSFGAAADGAIPQFAAQATPTPAPAFSFRGGVHWDMNRQSVQALETIQFIERSNGQWSILYPLEQVEVSRFKADLMYMFYGDQLKMITYDFGSGGSAADFAYLTGALDSVYGDHAEPEAREIIGVMDQIYPGYYTAERLTSRRSWTAGTDTRVFLYYYSENAYAVLYVNLGTGSSGPESYVTTGL